MNLNKHTTRKSLLFAYICTMVANKTALFIRQEQLFGLQDKIIVALSGGADSVALLRILLDIGYKVEAAHCNFHLRQDESDLDESFVYHICREQGVLLHTTHFDTRNYAASCQLSIEMAARELRYQWFEELRIQRKAQAIAVGHHQDDSIETVLLNLIRGTGISGLKGIRPKNGFVVRPLLCVNRKEITDYLDRIGQEYRTDSSNLSEEFTRNKIRLSLLPLLEEINPAIRRSLLHTTSHLAEAEAVYQHAISQAKKRVFIPGETPTEEVKLPCGTISIEALLQEPSPESLLHEILTPYGFTPSQTGDVYYTLKGEPGKIFTAKEWTLLKDRDTLFLYPTDTPAPLPLLCIKKLARTKGFQVPRDPNIACIDAGKVKHVLSLRTWKEGDCFIPFGMKGRKLVSDFLTDRKKSRHEKKNQLIVTDGEQIVWVVGERIDDRYRITNDTEHLILVYIES